MQICPRPKLEAEEGMKDITDLGLLWRQTAFLLGAFRTNPERPRAKPSPHSVGRERAPSAPAILVRNEAIPLRKRESHHILAESGNQALELLCSCSR